MKCSIDEFINRLTEIVNEDQVKIECEKKNLLKDCDKILKNLGDAQKNPLNLWKRCLELLEIFLLGEFDEW